MPVDAILFDKDGTLFDFGLTWNAWAGTFIDDLSGGDPARAAALALAAGFDRATGSFLAHSPFIAGTNRQGAQCLAAVLPGHSVEDIEHHLMISAADAPLSPAVPLVAFLDDLAGRGLMLGVMTNDTEYGARAHLGAAKVLDHFDFIAGFDSGHGVKPDPGPLLAFCRAVGVAPARAAMVGDSTHDLVAGRAAGMITIGVLTGMAGVAELAPLADVVLPDIGHIPAWLAQ